MSSKLLAPLLTCLGVNRKPRTRINDEKASYEPKYTDNELKDDEVELAASRFVSILLKAGTDNPSDPQFQAALKDTTSTYGYYDKLAEWIFLKLDDALRRGVTLGKAVKAAAEKAAEAAVGFAKEHPVYFTIIALGILVLIAPWVLEVLGFAELGPIEGRSFPAKSYRTNQDLANSAPGSFAAIWQARYAGYVPKGSLFSYFQRLGMVWH